MTPEYTSNITVKLIGHYGTDLDICEAAWVSSGNSVDQPSAKRQWGLINSMLREKHGSPFEEGYFSFWVDAPRAVRDESVRHRVVSHSCASLRYKIAEPRFYIPPRHRPLKKAAGFKQIQPVYEPYSDDQYERYVQCLKAAYGAMTYQMAYMLSAGFSETEAVRWITQDGLMMPYRARFNPRSLMGFLSLRTHDETANHISFPMHEINVVASAMEAVFKEKLPLTWAAFNAYGREAP